MGRSAEQRAANESTFRRANEQLERKATLLHFDERRTPYICECENRSCTNVVMLRHSEYEAVRQSSKHFVISPGHDSPPDKIIEEHEGFNIIEKTGEEGELVEAQDPRS